MPAAPTLSIIIVCKNPGARLRTALASVWGQRDVACEVIVVDGASTDGSREWLETQRGRIATLISEPDTGVYDAMNKGVHAARGEWLLFLGADDRLPDRAALSEILIDNEDSNAGVLAGKVVYEDGRVYQLGRSLNPIARNFIHHQSALYRRSLFDGGGFDASFAIMADYDFNLRLWRQGVHFESIAREVALCGTRGLSDSGRWRGYREEIAVRHRHFPTWRCWWWDALSVVRYLRKRIVRSLAST